jgi:hypothetical protein
MEEKLFCPGCDGLKEKEEDIMCEGCALSGYADDIAKGVEEERKQKSVPGAELSGRKE